MTNLTIAYWTSCYTALGCAVLLLICGIVSWQDALPGVAVMMLILAMVALIMALWNYNRARFSDQSRP